ncbi:MAG: MGH1-like glycoside hydrolase domain-containing protein, partial [Alphaproteobacteria bacterium]
MIVDPSALDDQARAILRSNDRGGYTIPTPGLYPFQWNWDSIFAALGFATFDEKRAWSEIETLFDAQWPNGMVPHIIFRHEDGDYFPGVEVWGTSSLDLKWPSSGISQPPLAATATRWIVECRDESAAAEQHARALLPSLVASHKWWHSARDPDGLGIMVVSHPWESGRDNLPDWDAPGRAIDT